ncbi:MAG TPA: putative O-glycosylation ligase, exosortase A system-associated [Janthinobacterium sp.]|nr:putative O-glycosylation ligase, exosortase A system-associated [Janthinobacterium sp.]
MRDLLLCLFIFGSLPFILKRPTLGALMWVWISVMSPHSQSWDYAASLPFAYIVAVVTLFSMLLSHEPKNLPMTPVSCALIAFVLWMNLTTPFALLPEASMEQWLKVMKIMLMTFVVMMLIRSKQDVLRLLWVIVFSLGFYGVKGGIFTIRSGGSDRVWGPDMTFIADNNACALAMVMTIPLMYYLQQNSENKWLRRALTVMMVLSALSALASYSRGGLLAIAAMGGFMWIKSGKKLVLGGLFTVCAPLLLVFMPSQWDARMDSIGAYDTDVSVQGRFNAWGMAYNLAKDRFMGGGFEVADLSVFSRYAPNPLDVHAAHSIYFEALGEHGFVGLGLYLLLGVQTWRAANWIIRNSRAREHLRWALGMATMIQASLIGFAVGGAFLSLLYYDVPYYLMAAIVATRALVEREVAADPVRRPPPRKALDIRLPAPDLP